MLILLVACARPVDCGALAGLDRDRCFHAALRETLAPTEAIATAGQIADPVVRGAAITEWLDQHPVDREAGQRMCQLLEHHARAACRRRLQSAHLQR